MFFKGLSIGNGRPVVSDMCMGSALHVNAHTATEDGKAIERLTRQKHKDYYDWWLLVAFATQCSRAKKVANGGQMPSKSSTTSSGLKWRRSIR